MNARLPAAALGATLGAMADAPWPMLHGRRVTPSLARFNPIVRVDTLARTASMQCGARSPAIGEAAAPHGLYCAPDPSSQIACTIGGNTEAFYGEALRGAPPDQRPRARIHRELKFAFDPDRVFNPGRLCPDL